MDGVSTVLTEVVVLAEVVGAGGTHLVGGRLMDSFKHILFKARQVSNRPKIPSFLGCPVEFLVDHLSDRNVLGPVVLVDYLSSRNVLGPVALVDYLSSRNVLGPVEEDCLKSCRFLR